MDDKKLDKYYRSFSGVDALAFLLFPSATPVLLGTVTTISYSMFREKVPVKLMSRISIPSYTKGLRYCAGTMIFTMVNKHWVNEVKAQVPWLDYYGKIKADELPPFDVMIICANEYGASASMMIMAAEMVDEAQTLSIEDIFTENQFSFVAKDINVMDSDGSNKIDLPGSSTYFVQPIESIVSLDMVVLSPEEEQKQKESDEKRRNEMEIYVNGTKVEFPDSKPRIENGATVAPLRFIFNAMGWDVEWIHDDKGELSLAQFQWDPVVPKDGWGYVCYAKYQLEIDHKTKKARFWVRDEGKDWDGKWTNISLGTPPYVDPKDRTVCEIRPLFEQALDPLIVDAQSWSVSWGGKANTVYIDSHEVRNHPKLSMDTNTPDNRVMIEDLQALLNENGMTPALKVSGVFDYTTKWALTSYQLQNKMTPSGEADQPTWAKLIQKKNKFDKSYPKNAKVINAGGSYVRKAPIEEDTNKLTTLKNGAVVSVNGPDSGGWVPCTTTVVGTQIHGFIKSSDIKY